MGDLTKNFSRYEVQCSCGCGASWSAPDGYVFFTRVLPKAFKIDHNPLWDELERGKGAGLSKLSNEEIALQDLDNRKEIDF